MILKVIDAKSLIVIFGGTICRYMYALVTEHCCRYEMFIKTSFNCDYMLECV